MHTYARESEKQNKKQFSWVTSHELKLKRSIAG